MKSPEDILRQIGCYSRPDHNFLSLNLTDKQVQVFVEAQKLAGDRDVTDLIVELLSHWVYQRQFYKSERERMDASKG